MNRFLEDKVKCFRLFRCFYEAGDKEMCKYIERAKSKSITFNTSLYAWTQYTRLLLSDVMCLTLFLTYSSHKEWKELDLRQCYIQDHGVHILHRGITSCDINVTITTSWLNNNGLTKSSSSAISDITISCRVKELHINGNYTVGEDERLYSIISDPSSMLEKLYMISTKLSSSAAIKLFTALSKSNKLRALWIMHNNITNEACDTIIMAMKNNSLVKLYMHGNRISSYRMCTTHCSSSST